MARRSRSLTLAAVLATLLSALGVTFLLGQAAPRRTVWR